MNTEIELTSSGMNGYVLLCTRAAFSNVARITYY